MASASLLDRASAAAAALGGFTRLFVARAGTARRLLAATVRSRSALLSASAKRKTTHSTHQSPNILGASQVVALALAAVRAARTVLAILQDVSLKRHNSN